MTIIKILGSGCANCKRVEQIAHQVITDMNIQAEVIKVTDYADMMVYNIMSTPGVVINEKLVSTGRIPTPAEMNAWLTSALETAS